MTGLRDAKKAQVRQALYDAAIALFHTEGYDAASVAAICKAAGVAKGTFFNHFPTKAHILADWYAAMMAQVEPAPMPDADVAERLLALAQAAITLASSDRVLWRAKHAHAPQSPDIQAIEAEADARFCAQTLAILTEAIHSGALRTDLDAGALADLYLGLVTGTIREWLNTGERFDLGERLKARIDTLINLARA